MRISLAKIRLPEKDLRAAVDQEALHELADSLREHGQLQPVGVRAVTSELYEIVFGARRYRAALLLEWPDIDAALVELPDDHNTAAKKLIENVQREALTPVEEAYGLVELIGDKVADVYSLQRQTGKSREWIRTRLEILDFPDEVQGAIQAGRLSIAAARHLSRIQNPILLEQYLGYAVENGMSGPEAEAYANNAQYAEAGILPPPAAGENGEAYTPPPAIVEHKYHCFMCRDVKSWREINTLIICGTCQDIVAASAEQAQHIGQPPPLDTEPARL